MGASTVTLDCDLIVEREVGCRFLAAILRDLVVDLLPLLEGAETRALQRRDMHEDILAALLRLDESVTLLTIEPFDSASRHDALQTRVYRPRTRATDRFRGLT